jgi:hypothetical protein
MMVNTWCEINMYSLCQATKGGHIESYDVAKEYYKFHFCTISIFPCMNLFPYIQYASTYSDIIKVTDYIFWFDYQN